MREYFMKTKRLGFSKWNVADLDLATQLWGEEEVTRFICADGKFTQQDIIRRLQIQKFIMMNYFTYNTGLFSSWRQMN